MARETSIAGLRRRIDRVDDRLLALLNERARLVLEVAAQKQRTNTAVYAPARERNVLARIARANRGPLTTPQVRGLFREIISASRSLEAPMRVAYLGPPATFAHIAARQQFGPAVDYRPAPTVAEVFQDVERGRADLGVVPIENSTEGMVANTLDLLVDSPLSICAEISLAIRHCLLAGPGTDMKAITRVTAHPQALAQCRRWLATRLPGIPAEEETSNARAAERAAAEPGTAAIAAAAAATTYGLDVLAEAIQDGTSNITRFLVLGAHDCPDPSGDDKTSLLFSVTDEVGILVRMLKPFSAHGIDLIKIESRPLRERPWEYYFFLDLKGHRRDARVRRALAEVERRALRAKVLGSYPAAPDPEG
jgi:chorismate mutase/prephenate dehydratase